MGCQRCIAKNERISGLEMRLVDQMAKDGGRILELEGTLAGREVRVKDAEDRCDKLEKEVGLLEGNLLLQAGAGAVRYGVLLGKFKGLEEKLRQALIHSRE